MTERPFAAAIAATIPTGDPHSKERMEWAKDAATAIAQLCLEHAAEAPGDESLATIASACDGMRSAYEHGMEYLRAKAHIVA